MEFRFFTINALDPKEGQDELNHFCACRRVVAVDRQFVMDGQTSFWSLCVTIAPGTDTLPDVLTNRSGRSARGNGSASTRVDYKEVLNEEDFARFADLRKWRKQIADAKGIPLYTVFTNEQLAEIVRQRVDSLEALGEIEGIGPARLERHGEGVIERLWMEAQPGSDQRS